MRKFFGGSVVAGGLLLALSGVVRADELGDVSTAFRWLGKNDRIAIEAYDDPKVNGTHK